MDHYQFVFENLTADEKNILIALLSEIGFEGFEEDGNWLKAFVPAGKFNKVSFEHILNKNPAKFYQSVIKEINWNQQWEAEFEPVVVVNPATGLPLVSVRAGFHSPVNAVLYDLVITPKMSFGTGHHATTYLMIQQMCMLDFRGKQVIDFGTGTAVLAILAEKLGAASITGIDIDEWSISNARENIDANGCSKINIIHADRIDRKSKADIILANINLNIIIANLQQIKDACRPGGMVLFSGILLQDEENIVSALKENNFIISRCFTKDNWLIVVAGTQ